MNEKTIKGMHRTDLVQLFENTVERINEISDGYNQVFEADSGYWAQIQKVSQDAIDKLKEIETTKNEVDTKSNELIDAHNKILIDNDEEESISTKLHNALKEQQEHNENLQTIKDKFFGYKETNENGEEKEVVGKIDEIKNFYEEQQEKYDDTFKEIEGNLLSGSTTISLAKNFNDKTDEYKKAGRAWSGSLIFILALMILYSVVFAFNAPDIFEINKILLNLIPHIPVFSFTIWLLVYVGNRRAENKKLEEAYKHKAVMSQSFIGYKKSIKELDADDNELLKAHMGNLLNAINKDAGDFLSHKGENHPVVDFVRERVNQKTDGK